MKNLFPNLAPGRWLKINFNEETKKTSLDLTDALICNSFIDEFHKKNAVEYSYGGFLEDRSYVWRNHYNSDSKAFIHLGIDYNVPAGTLVGAPVKGKIVHVMRDSDRYGGWGGRQIIEADAIPVYFIIGHMQQDFKKDLGDICTPGEIIGSVGDTNQNGNWFHHLHVQVIDETFMQRYKKKPERIDGYLQENHPLLKSVIDPERFIREYTNL